jgi:hypothetical protein
MALDPKRISTVVLRLLAVVLLLGWPKIASAAGTWSVISLPQKAGEVIPPGTRAVDAVSASCPACSLGVSRLRANCPRASRPAFRAFTPLCRSKVRAHDQIMPSHRR